jgi:hypothetical protein
MSDQNVKAAQKYLNAMFGGHKDWVNWMKMERPEQP